MADDEPPDDASDDYKIGPGHPPRETRFKELQSGNPNGRPPKNVQKGTLGERMHDILCRPTRAIRAGKRVQIQSEEATVEVLMRNVLGGNVSAAGEVLEIVKAVDVYRRRVSDERECLEGMAFTEFFRHWIARKALEQENRRQIDAELGDQNLEKTKADWQSAQREFKKMRLDENDLIAPQDRTDKDLDRFSKALEKRIKIKVGGEMTKVSRYEAVIIGLKSSANSGKTSAMRMKRKYERYSAEQAHVTEQKENEKAASAASVRRKIEDMAEKIAMQEKLKEQRSQIGFS